MRQHFPTNFGEVVVGEPAKVLMSGRLMISFFADIAPLGLSVILIIANMAKVETERCGVAVLAFR